MIKKRRHFEPEFKQEATCPVLEQGYSIEEACESMGKSRGVMVHSDQDYHYTSKVFQQQLWCYYIKQRMNRRGNCWNNAPMEHCSS